MSKPRPTEYMTGFYKGLVHAQTLLVEVYSEIQDRHRHHEPETFEPVLNEVLGAIRKEIDEELEALGFEPMK